MSKNASTPATTPADTAPDAITPEAAPDATTAALTPVTASIPAGQKSAALFGGNFPVDWAGSRAIAVSNDGKYFAFIGNNGQPYQGLIPSISARALAFGYAFGCKQKADSDGATDKAKTAETAEAITKVGTEFSDWCAPRTSGPREETATGLDLQVKTLLIAKLRPSKDDKGKLVWNTLTTAVKARKIKLTGFTGTADHLFTRYFEVVKLALDVEPTEEQISSFKELNISAAEKALAEAAKRQAEAAQVEGATPWA